MFLPFIADDSVMFSIDFIGTVETNFLQPPNNTCTTNYTSFPQLGATWLRVSVLCAGATEEQIDNSLSAENE